MRQIKITGVGGEGVWYEKHIGEILEVVGEKPHAWIVQQRGISKYVLKEDAELIHKEDSKAV